jgi:hypothetical protein
MERLVARDPRRRAAVPPKRIRAWRVRPGGIRSIGDPSRARPAAARRPLVFRLRIPPAGKNQHLAGTVDRGTILGQLDGWRRGAALRVYCALQIASPANAATQRGPK